MSLAGPWLLLLVLAGPADGPDGPGASDEAPRATSAEAAAVATAESSGEPDAEAAETTGRAVSAETKENAAPAETPESIEARLRATREVLARLRAEENSIIATLEELEAEIRAAEREAAEAEALAAEAESALGPLQEAERRAKAELRARFEKLEPRLFSRYRILRRGAGFSAQDPSELRRLSRAMDRVLQADLAELREARRLHREAEAARSSLQKAREEAMRRAEEARRLVSEAEEARARHRTALETVQRERKLKERLDAELREARARLDRELARLARAKRKGAFARRYGTLSRPVLEGIVEVPFGEVVDAKFGTITRHNGLDIRAPRGSAVRAVEKGRVAFAGWFRGYGNLVILDHGDGYHTLYGHLDEIVVERGAEVEAGQRLGGVGDTGSTKGPFLYFELREDGKPIDPLPWFGRSR